MFDHMNIAQLFVTLIVFLIMIIFISHKSFKLIMLYEKLLKIWIYYEPYTYDPGY